MLNERLIQSLSFVKTTGHLIIIYISISLEWNHAFVVRSTIILDSSQTSKLSFWIFQNTDSGEKTRSIIKADNKENLAASKIENIYQDLLPRSLIIYQDLLQSFWVLHQDLLGSSRPWYTGLVFSRVSYLMGRCLFGLGNPPFWW